MPQALRESALFARGPFRVDEQAEAVVKTELGVLASAFFTCTQYRLMVLLTAGGRDGSCVLDGSADARVAR